MMMKRLISVVLMVVFIVPPTFLYNAPKAHAVPVVVTADTSVSSWLQVAKETIIAIAAPIAAAAEVAQQISQYVLMPIAFIKSGQLLKSLTAGVIAFVNGQTNGTGAPLFVQNLQGNLQRVGDIQALAFLAQFSRNSNSPFSAAIMSSLRTNYLLNTSAAGFWAANRSTLSRYSPNVNAFLAGNWSQGGVSAWLALTTQPQNNPYMLYQNSQRQLSMMVGSAQSTRLSTLNWGQGFMSWCGPIPEDLDTESGDYAPGDGCIQKDGTPGIVRTPASVIASSLNKSLGAPQDKLVQLGQIGNQIGSILQSIGTIMGTVNLARDILNGGSTNGGLAGISNYESRVFSASTNSNGGSSIITTLNSEGSRLNGRIDEANNASSTAASQTQNQQSGQATEYTAAWNDIKNAATAARTSVTDLKTFCADAASNSNDSSFKSTANAQVGAAESALSTISAVVSQADSALAVSSPSANELNYALDQANATGNATASPAGSLSVSGGTLIDRMNLLNSNAPGLKSVCSPTSDSGG